MCQTLVELGQVLQLFTCEATPYPLVVEQVGCDRPESIMRTYWSSFVQN